MKRFCRIAADYGIDLEGSKIHGLNNVLTLSSDLHEAFDNLYFCLEAIDIVCLFFFFFNYMFIQVFNIGFQLVS